MSKFDPLWEYIREQGNEKFCLSFEEIENITGIPLDHSFLNYKKELTAYGFEVSKISLKGKNVQFTKL